MIAGAIEKDLGFVFKPAEGAGVDDAVAVTLIFGAPQRGWFGMGAPAALGAELGVGGESLALPFLKLFSGTGHEKIVGRVSLLSGLVGTSLARHSFYSTTSHQAPKAKASSRERFGDGLLISTSKENQKN
jgi:hypothetical protein